MSGPVESLVERIAALAESLALAAPFSTAPLSLDDSLGVAGDDPLLAMAEQAGDIIRFGEAVLAHVAGEISRRSERDRDEPLAKRQGEKSAVALVAVKTGLDQRRAARLAVVGDAVRPRSTFIGEPLAPERPAVAAALDAGSLSVEGAHLIVTTLNELSRMVDRDRVDEIEQVLVAQAAELLIGDLAKVCRRLRDHVDPDGVEPREEALVAQVRFKRTQLATGHIKYEIHSDPESAGYIDASLAARTAPRRQPQFVEAADGDAGAESIEHDTRTWDRRMLDALVSIARDSLKFDDGDLSGTDTALLVTITAEALRTGEGTAQIAGIDEPTSARTARRMACNARIIPVVLGGDSQPLDIGAGRRLFSKAQRQAMAVRDGGCLWPGCDVPPGQCEAAHITPWSLEPRTDLANGMLLCRFHHRRFDVDGWTLEHHGGHRYLVPPPWVDASRAPRRVGSAAIAA
jgi:5-methylcytosine-specific restriction protein A